MIFARWGSVLLEGFRALGEGMYSLFSWVEPSIQIPSLPTRSKICCECRRTYPNPDLAAICGDWDRFMGLNRHYRK